MTEEGLNRFVAGVEQAINARDWDAYGRFFSESLLMYAPGFPRPTRSREARVKMVQGIIAAFPDGRVELERSFVHGDWLCAQMTFSGTHTGPLANPDGTAEPKFTVLVRNGDQREGGHMSRAAIDQARAEINLGWLDSDPQAILAHTADDAVMLCPNEPRVDGNDALSAYLNGFFSQVKMTKVEMAQDREVIISGDLAVEHWSYDFESTMVGGDERFTDQGNFIGVWRRQADGTWKESHIMWNSWKPAS